MPVVPGIQRQLESATEAETDLPRNGLPVILKAASGGGGKGMRLIRSESEIGEAYAAAKSEALSSFGDEAVYIEKIHRGTAPHPIQILGGTRTGISSICTTGSVRYSAATRKSWKRSVAVPDRRTATGNGERPRRRRAESVTSGQGRSISRGQNQLLFPRNEHPTPGPNIP